MWSSCAPTAVCSRWSRPASCCRSTARSTSRNFTDNALKAATGLSDGRVYGVPFAYQAFTAFYNKGLFDELGLSEPETWDEFVATLDTLKENEIIPISTPGKDNWMMAIVMDAIGAPALRRAGVRGRDPLAVLPTSTTPTTWRPSS